MPKPTTTDTAPSTAMDLDPTSTTPDDNDVDDPITASYPVYLNPSLPLGRRLLVLQHPNRTDDVARPPPSELRLKPRAGMVEVDVPMDQSIAYDREKGLKWGRALQTSMAAKSGGSHGLAGGFGIGAVQQRGAAAAAAAAAAARKRAGDAADEDDGVLDWHEAARQDKVLRTQTLGGQYPETKEIQYMVGVFQGKDLHLTPVSSLVHLRPQLHHLDAIAQLERHAASASKDATAGATTSGTTAAPRAIHMTIKTTADGELVTTETIADRLRSVQSEPWRKLHYTDENEEAAWDVYNESLFLGHKPDERSGAAEQRALEDSVPGYATKWGDKELLEAVSGIKKPEPEPEPPSETQTEGKAKKTQAQRAEKTETAAATNAKGRTRGGGTAASRRGGRTRTAASKSGAAG